MIMTYSTQLPPDTPSFYQIATLHKSGSRKLQDELQRAAPNLRKLVGHIDMNTAIERRLKPNSRPKALEPRPPYLSRSKRNCASSDTRHDDDSECESREGSQQAPQLCRHISSSRLLHDESTDGMSTVGQATQFDRLDDDRPPLDPSVHMSPINTEPHASLKVRATMISVEQVSETAVY